MANAESSVPPLSLVATQGPPCARLPEETLAEALLRAEGRSPILTEVALVRPGRPVQDLRDRRLPGTVSRRSKDGVRTAASYLGPAGPAS